MSKGNEKDQRVEKYQREKRRKKKRRVRIVVFCVELIVLAVLCFAAYGMLKLDKVGRVILDKEELEIYQDSGDYTNIALLGLDSRAGELEGGVQSDTIIIVSINNSSHDVKLVSVYRDTLLQQSDGTYGKANSAYNYGGAEGAISLLNRNLDLDIQNYVSVNFDALVDVIDALGGLDIDMTAEEAEYTKGYASETAQVTGRYMDESLVEIRDGVQHLDGVHAVGYARIRYTSGDDFKRSERQRFLIGEVVSKAKKANVFTLNKIIDQVFPKISTSFSNGDMVSYAANIMKFNIVESGGFPYDVTTSDNIMNLPGSYVVPVGFSQNVTRLHYALFGEEQYQPSDKVLEVSNDIAYLTGIYEGYESIDTNFERNNTDASTE